MNEETVKKVETNPEKKLQVLPTPSAEEVENDLNILKIRKMEAELFREQINKRIEDLAVGIAAIASRLMKIKKAE